MLFSSSNYEIYLIRHKLRHILFADGEYSLNLEILKNIFEKVQYSFWISFANMKALGFLTYYSFPMLRFTLSLYF